jgi:flagellar hook-associated protein 1 FlgK
VTTIPPSSIFSSLRLASHALAAQQAVLNTIGHNLANASTPGYTRQRADLVSIADQGGVDVSGISRLRDRFLDFSFLTEQQALGAAEADDSLLQRLENVFNDPSNTGLSPQMNAFFQAFHDLSTHPTDQALRVAVVNQATTLAGTFNDMRTRLDQLSSDLTTEIQSDVTTANGYITQIADLNTKIAAAPDDGSANDLLDQRDQLVNELAKIVGVTATDRDDGTVQLAVTGTGVLVVDGGNAYTLDATTNMATDTVDLTASGSGATVAPTGGALASLLDARNSATGAVKQAKSDLDSLAGTLIESVNRLHASGSGTTEPSTETSVNAVSSAAVALNAAGLPFTPVNGSFDVIVHDATGAVTASSTITITAGTTTLTSLATALGAVAGLTATVAGGKLTITAGAGKTFTFADDTSDTLLALGLNTFFTGSTASDIAVNDYVADDPSKVAAAVADASGLVHPGDGSNALALADLSTGLTMASSTQTFNDYFATTVSRIGSLKQNAEVTLTRQQAALQVVQGLQQQTSGVSTDEELINLTQAQYAYAAAARFVTTINDVMTTLLQMF